MGTEDGTKVLLVQGGGNDCRGSTEFYNALVNCTHTQLYAPTPPYLQQVRVARLSLCSQVLLLPLGAGAGMWGWGGQCLLFFFSRKAPMVPLTRIGMQTPRTETWCAGHKGQAHVSTRTTTAGRGGLNAVGALNGFG